MKRKMMIVVAVVIGAVGLAAAGVALWNASAGAQGLSIVVKVLIGVSGGLFGVLAISPLMVSEGACHQL